MYICTLCGKNFTRKANLTYHLDKKVCTKKIQFPIKKDVNQELLEENLRLKGENKALRENPQTVNNTKINIVVPPAFLSVDNYQELLRIAPNLLHNAISKHATDGVSFLIKQINCNPKLPLYNSLKITNQQSPFVQVSDGTKFTYMVKKQAIAALIENKRHILQEYVDNHGDKYGEKILKKYQNYVDALDSNEEAQKDLELEVICMLLNVSEIIGSDDWTQKLLTDLKNYEEQEAITNGN